MNMNKLLEMFGIDRIDESKQGQIKEAIETLIESKAVEMVNEKVEEAIKTEKDALIESYENKFEDYKKDITEKFSNFVDHILEEELYIPEQVMKYAKMGEMYHDLIEQFKVRLAIDEDVLNGEVKKTLREAKDEILALRDQVNEMTKKNLDLERDAREMASNIYLRKKCDGLTESQKAHVFSILEDVVDPKEIDRKFVVIVESFGETSSVKPNVSEENDPMKEMTCEKCGNKVTLGEGESSSCPKCGSSLQEKVEPTKEDKTEDVNESVSPWDGLMNGWTKILKENKF